MYGTARSIIASMVKGVTVGFSKELEIQGVGFKANLKGKQLDLALGYSHPILMDIPEGIKITVIEGTQLKVEGCDKQLVGAITAEIRSFDPPEPLQGQWCAHRRRACLPQGRQNRRLTPMNTVYKAKLL